VDFKILRIHHLRLNDLQIQKVKRVKGGIGIDVVFDWFEKEMELTDDQWGMLTMLLGEYSTEMTLPFNKWLLSER
jgi:hypothetical protein